MARITRSTSAPKPRIFSALSTSSATPISTKSDVNCNSATDSDCISPHTKLTALATTSLPPSMTTNAMTFSSASTSLNTNKGLTILASGRKRTAEGSSASTKTFKIGVTLGPTACTVPDSSAPPSSSASLTVTAMSPEKRRRYAAESREDSASDEQVNAILRRLREVHGLVPDSELQQRQNIHNHHAHNNHNHHHYRHHNGIRPGETRVQQLYHQNRELDDWAKKARRQEQGQFQACLFFTVWLS
ncbi:unnamed protein product [Protopolystoma xenopodis]|uniref:Uncharacterized protein n=1 Tax=Protopolystoma xenopodis TaxID=117903 RepID=A0A3S4ZSG6_9PLAT|nr:unnamed protein product [Protopolystoma xenopodis]